VAFPGFGSTAKANYQHASEAKDAPPVADVLEVRPMLICAWCGFMMHYGRGPVSHGICPSCRDEFFPEVPK
jgi:rubrerythrin